MSIRHLAFQVAGTSADLLHRCAQSRCAFRWHYDPEADLPLTLKLNDYLLYHGAAKAILPVARAVVADGLSARSSMQTLRQHRISIPSYLPICTQQALALGFAIIARRGETLLKPATNAQGFLDSLTDFFLTETSDLHTDQHHVYFPPTDKFIGEHPDALERLVDFGMLGRLEISDATSDARAAAYCTLPLLPLTAGYRYDGQSTVSGTTHRVWRRVRWYMEQAIFEKLPEEIQEKLKGKPKEEPED